MSAKKNILARLGLLYIMVTLLGLAILSKALYTQLSQGEELREKAKKISLKDITVPPERGNILASDGRILATSIPSYDIYMDPLAEGIHPDTFQNNAQALARALAVFPGKKSATAYYNELVRARQSGKRYLALARNLKYPEMKMVCSYPILRKGKNRGGLILEHRQERELPHGDLAARTIGYFMARNPDGNFPGIEGAFDEYLRGKEGLSVMQKLPHNNLVEISSSNTVLPENGGDVVTSIDIDIQDVAETALRKALIKHEADHGTVVIMEVATGEIKAIVNLGRNRTTGVFHETFNYALAEAVDPGSTFKLASYMAAFEDGYIGLNDIVDNGEGEVFYYGKRVHDDGRVSTKGILTIEKAFALSSNVSVTKVIDHYYRHQEAKFIERIHSFGLGNRLGMDIKGEARPYIKFPTREDGWSRLSLTQIAYGYEMMLAPIHTLAFYNAVANNGRMVRPRLIRALRKQSIVEKQFEPEVIKDPICTQATLDKAHQMLRTVVDSGTAKNIRTERYSIAGKTGTAQIANARFGYRDKRHYASFVGYFPADQPKYSGIVTVYATTINGTGGGVVAAPVFREVADRIYATLPDMFPVVQSGTTVPSPIPVLTPGNSADALVLGKALGISATISGQRARWVERDSIPGAWQLRARPEPGRGFVPDVLHMGLKDALYLLENSGLEVEVKGRGTVSTQSLTPGSPLENQQKITIELSMG